MIRKYRELESQAEFDIGSVVKAEFGREVAMIVSLIFRSSLFEEIVYAHSKDWSTCQTVDDLILDDIDGFLLD